MDVLEGGGDIRNATRGTRHEANESNTTTEQQQQLP